MTPAGHRPARLLENYLVHLENTVKHNQVLDLACGSGRNGIFLVRHNIPVLFADINPAALENISNELAGLDGIAKYWEVDFENSEQRPLAGKTFDAILAFNYLHRPLIPDIRNSLAGGGLLLYETFTAAQAAVGRPSNPDFLLQPGELRDWFEDWEILHYFEGSDQDPQRFYANLVARKPVD